MPSPPAADEPDDTSEGVDVERADDGDSELDDDLAAGLPPRTVRGIPWHVYAVIAAAFAFVAIEPTFDLRYTLLGPAEPFDLGTPGHYALDAAKDATFVEVGGFASDRRGRFSHWGKDSELFVLIGTPIIVRRPQGLPPPPNTAELYEGRGRLLLLEETKSDTLDRWLRPNARYTSARLQFAALGELPPAKKVWVFIQDDVPRGDWLVIAWPLLLWVMCTAAVVRAVRRFRAGLDRD